MGVGIGIGVGLPFGGVLIEVDRYYVRPTGSTYGTGDGSSYENAWSGFSSIVWASVTNKELAICGTHTEALNVGASNVTILGNDANESGTIDGENTRVTGVDVASRDNVTITSLSVIDHTTQNLFVRGTSLNCITNNCTFTGSGNQGIQHYNTATAIHNNANCSNCADDGISQHDSTVVIVNGGTFSNCVSGINTIDSCTTTINGSPTFSGNSTNDVWATNADSNESCVITINGGSFAGLVQANVGAKIIANNVTLPSVDIANGAGNGYFEATGCVIQAYEDNSGAFGTFTNCLVTWTGINVEGDVTLSKSRVTNDAIVTSGASVTARHTLFSGGDDMQLDFQSGSTADIAYCIFYNMAVNQFGVAFRTGTTITNFHNCTFNGVANVGRGHFAQEPNTAYNHIFTDLDIGAFQSTGAQTLENCCFFDNNTNKSGTFTSNDEVTTDPVITDAANLDFSLGSGSSCIGTGQTLSDDEGIASADWGNGSTTTPTVTTGTQPASWNIGAFVNT